MGVAAITVAIPCRLITGPTGLCRMALGLCLAPGILSFLIGRMGVASTIVVCCKAGGSISKVNGTQGNPYGESECHLSL